jgi:hypothetical protein
MDWWLGRLDDDIYHAVSKASQDHFESIKPLLPEPIIRLIESSGLHDGDFQQAYYDEVAKTVRMTLKAWNSFNGDYRVDYIIEFSEVISFWINATLLNKRCGPGFGDLGYYEVDLVEGGGFSMCFLFWSGIEIEVVFGSINVEETRRGE